MVRDGFNRTTWGVIVKGVRVLIVPTPPPESCASKTKLGSSKADSNRDTDVFAAARRLLGDPRGLVRAFVSALKEWAS